MSTTVWFALVVAFACLCLMIGLGFLGAALDRNRGRLEDAEKNRRVLENVRAGQH